MKVEDGIFFQLSKAGQAGANFWSKKVAHLDVTAVQAVTLNFLGEEDHITSQALGQKIRITSATMTGILDRLENMALIERRPHPEDRRAILVCLTEKGAEYAAWLHDLFVEADREFLRDFSREEEQFLRGLLRRVAGLYRPDIEA